MENETKLEPIVYTVGEAAELLGVTKATVYRRIKDGVIPTVKMGTGRIRIPKKRFHATIDGHGDMGTTATTVG